MVQVSYPGVYVQEASSGVHTITGVATSITAFFGRALLGPLNQPVHCLSYSDFTRAFGGPHPSSDLATSVRQFYDNGGTECYVVRLAKDALTAQVTLNNYPGAPVLVATASAAGTWANTVRLQVDYNTTNADDTFNLTVIQESGGQAVQTESFTGLSMNPTAARFAPDFVTSSSRLISLALDPSLGDPQNSASAYNNLANSFAGFSQGRRPLGSNPAAVQGTLNGLIHPGSGAPQAKFDISVDGSSYVTVDLSAWAVPATYALIQSQLTDAINGALAALSPAPTVACTLDNVAGVGRLLRITAATGQQQASVRVRRASSNDLAAALMLGVDQGGVEPVRWSNFRPACTGTFFSFGAAGAVDNLNAIAALLQNAVTAITIDGVAVPLNAAPYNLVTTAATDAWYRDNGGATSPNGNNDGVREKLRLIANAISNTAALPYKAAVYGQHLAILAQDGTLNKTPTTVSTGVAAFDSALVPNVRQYTLGTAGTGSFSSSGALGTDGSAPGLQEYTGDPVHKTGFYALDTVDLFNLMVLPTDHDLTEATRMTFWGPASIYCQSRRAFLVIDAPESWSNDTRPAIVNDTSKVNDLRNLVIKDYSAVFYPRLKYTDPSGVVRLIGPSGAIAGVMARIDASRGVWKAPAGTEADLRGLAGLEVKLTDLENGVLNKLGVNCQRIFPTGFVSWGARTMDGSDDSGSDWKYIPIRRFALMIEESLYRGTQWAVFEPNDEPLWARLRLNVGVFMTGLFRQGAFQGSTPDQAFYVKCDSETTTQADRNLGIVNIEVGFAPLKPAEFVVITIRQMAGNLS